MNPANHFRFTFAILSAAALSGPAYAQSPMTYRGICDASASVALGKDHFVVEIQYSRGGAPLVTTLRAFVDVRE